MPGIETAETPLADAPAPAIPAPLKVRRRREGWLVPWLSCGPLPQRLRRGQILLIGTILLLVTAVFAFVQTMANFRAQADLTLALTAMTAEVGRQGLTSGAEAHARLAPLAQHRGVRSVALYASDGTLIAKAGPATDQVPDFLSAITPGLICGWHQMTSSAEVQAGTDRLGWATVNYDLGVFWSRAAQDGFLYLLVASTGVGAAWLLGARFSRRVTAPYEAVCALVRSIPRDGFPNFGDIPQGDVHTDSLVDALREVFRELRLRDEQFELTRRELDQEITQRRSMLAEQSGARLAAAAAVQESEARYRNLFENNPMPMFVMDLETLDFVAANYAALRHYGYTEREILRMSLPMITHHKDSLDVVRAFRRGAKSFDAGEWQQRRKTGEVIEVQLTAHAIVFGGKVAKIILANDVTERNRAQRQLQEMHKQLVSASRQAGMAEVATDVLHNVGNVLNSVNVSAAVLAAGVRDSKVTAVQKLAALFATHREDLPAFFATGAKGQKLPDYLTTLAAQLEQERGANLEELDQLSRNIEHIKQVVAFQQNHAKVSCVYEKEAVRSLVDEALRLTSGDFCAYGVQTSIECTTTESVVETDRHKVLQILVNLITNAREAMIALAPGERKLHIRIAQGREGLVAISVRDVGCGIPAESLNMIFNHGFTTKKTGHGFGLHGAANAAKELGGSLRASSAGAGAGATFTLELPRIAATRERSSQAAA